MTNHTTIDFDTVNELEYTRAALRALSRMMGALMAQGDGIELYALGYEVLLDTQEQRLAQIEEVMRADVASRKKSILESAPKNPQRKAPIQVDEARLEQIDAEMKLKPGTVERVLQELLKTPESTDNPELRSATA